MRLRRRDDEAARRQRMSTIIKFPDASARRPGPTMGVAQTREGGAKVLILPVIRIEPVPKKALRPAAAAVDARDPDAGLRKMPDTTLPIRTWSRVSPAFVVLFPLFLSLSLAGCSGGDFGRVRASSLDDNMHRWIGKEANASVGLRASEFQLTDQERLMRDLAYPLIEPPHSRPLWKSVFGEYKPIPSPWRQTPVFDRTAY
eukprot:gene2336-3155_t